MEKFLAFLIIGITYVGLALGHLPYFRMNRAGLTMVSVSLLLLLGVIDFEEAWQAIDGKTLVFLFGIMILNAHLGYAGFFSLVIQKAIKVAKSPFGLLVVVTLFSGLLSALFLNDTMALMLTPIVYGMTRSLGLDPKPYLLSLMLAVNTGSMITPTGNPQNMVIASLSGLKFLDFIGDLLVPALLSLLLQILLIYLLYPQVRSLNKLQSIEIAYRVHRGLLVKGILVSSGLFIAFILGCPLAESSFIAGGILLLTRRLRSERYFSKIDWELLVMFAGLFILTSATKNLGIPDYLKELTKSPHGLLLSSVILSLAISNVPAVLILSDQLSSPQMWLLLAGGSTLAGNLTILASVANLIVTELTGKEGYKIGFFEHLRIGLPLTVLSLLVLYFWVIFER